MGLTKTNYVSKDTGITLPVAYAVLKDLVLNGNNARAIFVIQSSRETTETLKPIDKVEVNFEWDRKADLAKMAYEKAKTEYKEVERFDKQALKIVKETKYGVLYGWLDDIR